MSKPKKIVESFFNYAVKFILKGSGFAVEKGLVLCICRKTLTFYVTKNMALP